VFSYHRYATTKQHSSNKHEIILAVLLSNVWQAHKIHDLKETMHQLFTHDSLHSLLDLAYAGAVICHSNTTLAIF
jgi:hypothetical protein